MKRDFMQCQEVTALSGAYLDDELDGQTTDAVRAHLTHCAECAAFYRSEAAWDAELRHSLNRPAKTESLWVVEEAFAIDQFASQARRSHGDAPFGWARANWSACWRELLWPSPSYYLGLAAVWLVLLALWPDAVEPLIVPTAGPVQLSIESRQLLREQRRVLSEMLTLPESPIPTPPSPGGIQPRSEHKVLSTSIRSV